MGVRQMVDAGQECAEMLAVVDHAPDRDAAEADAMVPLLPTDQTGARALAPHPVIGERDLERGVDRLRSAVGEEHVEIGRAHVELQSLMRNSYAVFCLKK